MAKHFHKWIVRGCALCPPTVMVECKCGVHGNVKNHDRTLWESAYYAPSAPFALPEQYLVRDIAR